MGTSYKGTAPGAALGGTLPGTQQCLLQVPGNQTAVLASSVARPSKHKPRSPSQQQWRIVAATVWPALGQTCLDKHQGSTHY